MFLLLPHGISGLLLAFRLKQVLINRESFMGLDDHKCYVPLADSRSHIFEI